MSYYKLVKDLVEKISKNSSSSTRFILLIFSTRYFNSNIFLVKVTEWPPIGKIAAHSAYEMFSWYKYLIVSLVFSHLGFWSGILFLIAPFPDLCLLVLFYEIYTYTFDFLKRFYAQNDRVRVNKATSTRTRYKFIFSTSLFFDNGTYL